MSLQRSRSTAHGGTQPEKTESAPSTTVNNAETGSADWALHNQAGFGNVAIKLAETPQRLICRAQEVGAEEEAAAKETDALQSPALQSVLSMNPKATESQKAALRILDTELSGPWQNVSWSRVQRDAAWRVDACAEGACLRF